MARQNSQGDLDVYGLLVDIKTDLGELSGTMKAHVEHDREHQTAVLARLDRLEQARASEATATKDKVWKVAGALGVAALGAVGGFLSHLLGWK